ncbi:hypothetical protein PILCRDRAFT_820225 [Piloderma croceum F 1598]|uniref:MYND-type domain-containing protein n=1 Tax=Piloderma croceum (strain F 1598) TaxID=765440 RepID=A0A0C3FCL5_PILCF|nr:hypothetical protein PILCRDRAFT_820225 [Piloderma croceum F 1598]
MVSLWSAMGFTTDSREDPAKWNRRWEARLKKNSSVNMMEKSLAMFPKGAEQGILTDHRHRLRLLCNFQNHLTIAAMQSFVRDNFESKWLESSVSYREKHLLEGMIRTCTMMQGMEDYRAHCEEISLLYLEKDGGRGYLRLLKHFMVKDPTSVSTVPIYLPSPQWDRFVMGREDSTLSEQELAFKAYYDGVRNTFICDCLFNTLSSFHGYSAVPVQIVKAPTRNRLPSNFEDEMSKRLGSLAKPVCRLIKQDVVAARMESNIACESCTKIGKSSDFRVCSICKLKFDRRIYYCSRECQKADWAPRHKAICGKAVTFKSAQASAVGPQAVPFFL